MALPKAALLLGTAATLAGLAAPAAAQSSASAYTKAARYDAMRRPTGTIAPDPDGGGPLAFAAVRNSYDAAGRLLKMEKGELSSWQSELVAPASWSGFTVHQVVDIFYDAAGRKVKETLSGGGVVQTVTQYSYDGDNRPECTAVRMNPGAFGSLPASACTQGSSGNFGSDRIVRKIHDAVGQLLQVREAVGTSLEAAEATYSYTANGRKQFVIDGRGNRAEFRYDGHDRLARWVFSSPSAPGAFNDATQATALASAGGLNEGDYEEYGYDAVGNRTSLRTRAGEVLGFSYDALNRATAKDRPGGELDVAYAYDLRGLQTSASFPATGEALTNAYDKARRLSSATSTMNGMSRTFAYLYDANGNRTRMTWNDGFWVGYDTDGLNRITAIREYGSTLLVSYGYDAQGRRSGVTRGNGTATSYGYDAAGRPNQIGDDLAGTSHDQVLGFSYNPAGQIVQNTRSNDAYAWTGHYNVSRNYIANGLNQYSLSGSIAPNYDARGNVTQAGGPIYSYTSENMLVSSSGGISLAYDPANRLAQTAGGSAGTTRFGYDGTDLAAEYDGAGNLLRRYVHGPGTDDPVNWYEGSGTSDRRWLHPDERGSLVAVSNSSGTVTTVGRYDEYGIPASTNIGRFQYTGQTWLPELGMYHYKARIYSPTLGRFLQRDPVGYDDQVNAYAYVGSDPVNLTDPDGRIFLPPDNLNPDKDWSTRTGQLSPEEKLEAAAMIGVAASLWAPGPEDLVLLGLARFAYISRIEGAIAAGGRLVLYSGKAPSNLRKGDLTLNMPRWLWSIRTNDGVLQAAIRQGRPIKDTHVDEAGEIVRARPGSVLARERRQIEGAGWKFDSRSGEWKPPSLPCTPGPGRLSNCNPGG